MQGANCFLPHDHRLYTSLAGRIATGDEITRGAPNGKVSGRAFYTTIMNRETTTVKVVDGRRLKAEEKDFCDDVKCYFPGSARLDLRLKLPK